MTKTSDLNAIESSDPYDFCIIGAGFVGTVVGTALARKGIRTLILESGGSLARWLVDGRLKALAAYEVTGDANYPAVRTKARAIGGNSNFWTGRCERYHPSDFTDHAYAPKDNPWPLTYHEIAPYYGRAENTLRVRGGTLSEHAPPRDKPLPLPARTDISSLKSMVAEVGITLDDSPTATPQHDFRFFRAHRELMPEFTASPNGTLVSGATVTRLLTDDSHRVVGAEARAMDGTIRIARAHRFVVACGGIETPRLLLLSRSDVFPRGIGNHNDRVGRSFNEHPGINMYGNIRHNRHTLIPRHKIGRTHQFYDKFRAEGLGSVLPVIIQSWVFPHHLIQPRMKNAPRGIGTLLSRFVRATLYIGATIEMALLDDNRVTLSNKMQDRFGNPLAHLHLDFAKEDRRLLDRTRELILDIFGRFGADGILEREVTWSRHHLGTCRMGNDPKTSVVDRDLKVHDCPNLWLCGGETFVTGAAVPPVMTIAALSHRLSDHLIETIQAGQVASPRALADA